LLDRRQLLLAATALLSAPLARAQQPPRLARIGVLPAVGDPVFREVFTRALRELGWVEGKNLVIDWRPTPKPEEMPAIVADLVRQKPDVIVSRGPQPTREVAKATSTIPVVFIAIADPVKLGLVRSVARPGGNLTGFATTAGEGYLGKLLQLLKEAAPRTSHVGLLINPGNPMHVSGLARIEDFAQSRLGLRITVLKAQDAKELEPAFDLGRREGVDALVTLGDLMFSDNRDRIAALALKHRLPTVFMFSNYADAGGMLAYAVSMESFFRNAARQADKILRGAHPQDIPVEMADKYEFVINLRTAKQLGLRIPESLLIQATRVIE
jgi:putative ABC transport system substrate-binding protein